MFKLFVVAAFLAFVAAAPEPKPSVLAAYTAPVVSAYSAPVVAAGATYTAKYTGVPVAPVAYSAGYAGYPYAYGAHPVAYGAHPYAYGAYPYATPYVY